MQMQEGLRIDPKRHIFVRSFEPIHYLVGHLLLLILWHVLHPDLLGDGSVVFLAKVCLLHKGE